MNAQSAIKEYKKKMLSTSIPLTGREYWGHSIESVARRIMKENQIYCRWAPSLGKLEATHQEIWGTEDYVWWKHRNKPTVFFGLYDLRDYLALWQHKGKKWVLWAGSDIRNLVRNFYETDGKLHKLSGMIPGFNESIVNWLKKDNIEHWVENVVEKEALENLGISVAGWNPSYLGNTNLPISYKHRKNPSVFISSGSGRQEEYGFGIVEKIAKHLSWMKFHLYGAEWKTKHKNVIVHGRVIKEQMNEETSRMQIGLRLNNFDGFSEIMAKAVLRGQYAVGKVVHPLIPTFDNDMELIVTLNKLGKMKIPNLEVRKYYSRELNNFPWNNNYEK